MKKEQIEFLKELQEEMLTQDNVGQASPRFWAVGDYKWRIVPEGYGEKTTIFCFDLNENHSFTYEEWVDELLSYLDDEQDDQPKAVEWMNELKLIATGERDLKLTVEEVLDEIGYEYDTHEEELEHIIHPNTFFLTLKEAKEHISNNAHHYGKDAHPYAMTAWRSPQVEQLYNILETIDWEQAVKTIEKENA